MCGIVGIIGKTNKELLHKMAESLIHRGPDDSGFYIEPNEVALGHRRLSIIDIHGGKQPFTINEYHLIYNGEIYNYLELKSELEKLGHIFKTKSDTEVLLRAFIQYGPKCLEKLNGIFAFAIWNSNTKELFLSRDRFGVCPLYYSQVNSNFYFASETKALLQVPEIKRDLNHEAIHEYLTFRYVRSEITFFKDIKKFPPAHFAIYKNQNLLFKRYWHLDDNTSQNGISLHDSLEKYRELLVDSVKIRALRSDVPVGAYLSSGIDSSSIVSLMSQFSKVKTFTIGFNSEVDEFNESRDISRRLGTEHNEILLNKSDWDLLPKIIYHLDEPVGDPIILPTYSLSSFASKSVKVVLTGDGADELLGGYVHHQSFLRLQKALRFISPNKLQSISNVLKFIPANLLNIFFPYPANLSESGKERAITFLNSISSETSMYLNFASLFTKDETDELYSKSLKEKLSKYETNHFSHTKNLLNGKLEANTLFHRVVSLDLQTWLPNQILHKSDRLLLANSLEGRQPFLDYRLAEFVHNLPDNYKTSFTQTKLILRKAMKNILPRKNINLKKKAFYLPIQGHFFPEYQALIRQCLAHGNTKLVDKEILGKDALACLVKDNIDKTDILTTKKLFALAVLELWLNTMN